jgi:hypothetical protein
MPQNMGAFMLPINGRIILLLLPSPSVDHEFIEAFNSNRGFNVRVFHEGDLAVSWLRDRTTSARRASISSTRWREAFAG